MLSLYKYFKKLRFASLFCVKTKWLSWCNFHVDRRNVQKHENRESQGERVNECINLTKPSLLGPHKPVRDYSPQYDERVEIPKRNNPWTPHCSNYLVLSIGYSKCLFVYQWALYQDWDTAWTHANPNGTWHCWRKSSWKGGILTTRENGLYQSVQIQPTRNGEWREPTSWWIQQDPNS